MEEKLQSGAPIKCPLCGLPVGIEGPASAAAPPMSRADHLAAVTSLQRGRAAQKKLLMIVGGAGVLVTGAIIALLAQPGGVAEPSSAAPPTKPAGKYTLDDAPEAPAPVTRQAASVQPAPPPKPVAPASPVPAAPVQPAPPPPRAPSAGNALPSEVLLLVRQHLLSLPPYYRDLCVGATERSRVEALVASGKGTAEDIQFLKDLCLSDKVKVVRDELSVVTESLRQLEKDALEGLPVDRLTLYDGRTLLGRVVAETPDDVRIERKMAGGVGGLMNVKRVDIKALEKGKGPGVEFKTRWEAARKGSASEQAGLVVWCKENGLPLQARFLSLTILSSEPGHPLARAEAGLPSNPIQRAIDAATQGGLLQFEGRSWTAVELKEKLLRDGTLALLNGEWYVRKERTISVPGLFRYDRQDDKPVAFSPLNGAVTAHDTETVYAMVQDLATNSFVEKADVKFQRRFFSCPLTVNVKAGRGPGAGPVTPKQHFQLTFVSDQAEPPAGKAMTGDLVINVPVNQPIIEASVKTLAEVKSGGSITIFLLHEGQRVKVYQCAAREDDLHKLPDLVRGKQAVDLVAVIGQTAAYTPKTERRVVKLPRKNDRGLIIEDGKEVVHDRLIPDFKATLFPSNSNTVEVFRLKVTVGEPAAALNDLFRKAGASEILKTK